LTFYCILEYSAFSQNSASGNAGFENADGPLF
jgi:hypothetical protein